MFTPFGIEWNYGGVSNYQIIEMIKLSITCRVPKEDDLGLTAHVNH